MISCIVCTRNPRRDYLARALTALSGQTVPSRDWELLMVDNGSQPPVSDLPGWQCAAAARIVAEAQPGLTPARLLGIRESRGELLVFVDDDNLLAPDYLAQAAALDTEFHKVAVWSGSIMPEFEQPPPEWTNRYWHVMALRPVERNVWSNSYFGETLPIGAGMVVRRPVAEHYARQLAAHPERLALDRRGRSLLAAGDTDLGFAALDLGLACGVAKELRLTHLIPPNRLEETYLVNLARSVTHSHTLLSLLRGRTTYSVAQLRRKQARYLWCFFDADAHRRRYHQAIAAGAIAGMKDFRRQMSAERA